MSQDQASGLRRTARTRTPADRGRVVAVASGKGGVGKTNLAANLAIAASAQRARVLLVDADLGLANVDVLLGLKPERHIGDVLSGRYPIRDALTRGPRGVDLLASTSGLRPESQWPGAARLLDALSEIQDQYDLVLVDAGAGVAAHVVELAAACGRVLVVLTSDPTSLADAYALLKLVWQVEPAAEAEVLVNAARSEGEGRRAFGHLRDLAARFLGRELLLRGVLPLDARLERAARLQRAVVEAFPTAASSRRLTALAHELIPRRGAEAPRRVVT
ncbi:MAG: AAA family ATPase [Proteobacteria bacterium]|nr:AAA family ATPase [Pseudomonadota bacterium]